MESRENLDGVVCAEDSDTPYISLVATARNDNHGGNLLGRMQVFVDAWINQCKRHNLSAELILVEWNPPPEKPGLAEALRWPADTGPCRVRIIQVPPELHRRFRHAEALPLYQMIAKNVGIRRARGEFILVTNIDVVFSNELVSFLAQRKLQKGRIYRIDRWDTGSNIPVNGALDDQLTYARNHLIRLCTRHGIFTLTKDGLRENLPNDIARPESGIYFGAGWFEVELYIADHFRWIENEAELFMRVPPAGGILNMEIEPGPGVGVPPQPLHVFDRDGNQVAEWMINGRTTLQLSIPPAPGGIQKIRFHVPNGGLPVPNDPRIMNFRFFHCDWIDPKERREGMLPISQIVQTEKSTLARLVEARMRSGAAPFLLEGPSLLWKALRVLRMRGTDIFDAGAEFQIGSGWHELERNAGAVFRWAAANAEVILRFNDGTTSLGLIVEPGPAIDYKPFDLVARLQDGTVVGKARVDGLTYVQFALPLRQGDQISVFLNPEGVVSHGGSGVASDTRTLIFRVFTCCRGTVKSPSAAPPVRTGAWATRTVGTRPPEVDWQVHLKDNQKEIAEMGKPGFLHLYACGDFQLMARENWWDVRGYAELDQFSFHLDSILSYTAHHMGIEEEVLLDPMRIYHIEHGIGSGWTPEGHDTLMNRINKQGIENLVFKDLALMVAQMRRLHAPLIFNLDNWGMAELNLTEITPHGALAREGIG